MEEFLSSAEIRSLAKKGYTVLPIAIRCCVMNTDALAIFRAVERKHPEATLLEGVEQSGQKSRLSWVGFGKIKSWTLSASKLNGKATKQPLGELDSEFKTFRSPKLPDLPRFYAGVTGYLGYECVRYLEPKLNQSSKAHPIPHPECYLQVHETWIVLDQETSQVWIISSVYLNQESLSQGISRARRANRRALKILNTIGSPSKSPSIRGLRPFNSGSPAMRARFEGSVRKLQSHIRAGDIFQCVLSHPFWSSSRRKPIELYAKLRGLNPSPYQFFMSLPGEVSLFGASPERLVKVDHRIAETHPIAGTRPRGKDLKQDQKYEQSLLNSSKERAEHMMLVDLGRNDLGRVSEPGTVEVHGMMRVERFSHVMHLVSTVRGKLQKGISEFEALLSCFPAGTLSGAPKFRAMELIQSTEFTPRGVYGGAIVQLGFNGYLDSCIAIRSAIAHKGRICIQAGAGIVYDSRPGAEYEETLQKSRVLREVCR